MPFVVLFMVLLVPVRPSLAAACGVCPPPCCHGIPPVMEAHENWLAKDFFKDYVLPAMMRLTEQLTALGMHQMLIIGTFFDAKHQLETQRLFQELTAQAHKDYHSSVGMCTFGTNVRSLAAAERNGQLTSFVLSQRSQDRHLANKDVNAGTGFKEDREGRLEQFIKHYCDLNNNDGDFGESKLCKNTVSTKTRNKDVNYTQTMERPWTLDVDFSENAVTEDERAIIALSNNIYGHNVFEAPTKSQLKVLSNQEQYLELRSVVAKRSVAENSFNTIVGLKAAGTEKSEETGDYMAVVLKQLGANQLDAEAVVGKRPSYYAQMEILAQKIYQDPEFFTNLYDKPMNVMRKEVAMQAIELMLDRDMYKSELRYETMLAVLLEMDVIKLQKAVQNRMGTISKRGKEN